VPDVASDASPTRDAVVTSHRWWHVQDPGSGGTSASAPLWAGLVALADQYSGRHLGFINAGIYRIGRSASYHMAFHDVTTATTP